MRLITGPGGVGKTRLALQLADSARQLGWWCEWVGADQEAGVVSRIGAAKSGRVLLMVDYAETRTGLSLLMRAAAQYQGPGLRVLLLARSAGPWWDQLGAGEPGVRELVSAAGPDGTPVTPAVSPAVTGSLRLAPRSLRRQHQMEPRRRYSPAGSRLRCRPAQR